MFSSYGQLLDALAKAIIRQEGRGPFDTNPGDLRAAPWLAAGLVNFKHLHGSGGFWNPSTRAEGVAGIYHVAMLHIAELQNVQQFVFIWAPPSENNSAAYLAHVQEWTGITDATKPLYLLVSDAG